MNDREKRKGTKTHKNRTLVCSEPLRKLLVQMKQQCSPLPFVFVVEGNVIKHHQLTSRWKQVLTKVEVEHRKLYNTRHTFISHALEKGVSPLILSSQTGHDTQTLFQYYAGSLPNTAKLPEVFDF
ncbi:tyrosine-type recombinase/integrase [Aerosakkonemataceae cyanobacterium BLCC-F50]|uniref:Tyrosine-type recombinase/integrase n=1 Tax=Floridaenema flaviceps BLCC-F50 TaxID=3153642 RepID=A0ABV4XS56_9CYAN